MADEIAELIRQEMILKADQVFTTLNRLNTEFTKFGDAATAAIGAAMIAFDKLSKLNAPHIDTSLLGPLNSITNSAKQAADALDKVGQQKSVASHTKDVQDAGNATKQLAQQTNNWLLSMETLGRVIQTQLLVRSLNVARDVIRDSYTEYLQFSKSSVRFMPSISRVALHRLPQASRSNRTSLTNLCRTSLKLNIRQSPTSSPHRSNKMTFS